MKILVYIFSIIPVISFGQVLQVDFEDNELTPWIAKDIDHWCISDELVEGKAVLKHCYDDSVANSDWISFFHDPVQTQTGPASWEFFLRFGNTPSSNNKWAVLLTSNELPGKGELPDNYLALGVNLAGNNDELILWERKAGMLTEAINSGYNWQEKVGPDDWVGIRIERTITDQFDIFIQRDGDIWDKIASGNSTGPDQINHFTLYYDYSATRDQNLWFDRLKIMGFSRPVLTLPSVENIFVHSSGMINAVFNRPVKVDSESGWCIEEIGCTQRSVNFEKEVDLEFANKLVPGMEYQLKLPALIDIYGNKLENGECSFYYPKSYDILITEIMADPTPEVMLPDEEYIELFNACKRTLTLKNWTLSSGNNRCLLPAIIIEPAEYVVLSKNRLTNAVEPASNVLTNLPPLKNTGGQLILSDASGKMIHAVNYSDNWHANSEKKLGGWSLEMINCERPCIESVNWTSSAGYRGGTPGKINSVVYVKEPLPAPELWRVAVSNTRRLALYFSEPLDSVTVSSSDYYFVDKGIGHPVHILPAWPTLSSIELTFVHDFRPDTEYTIRLTADICNCAGTRLETFGNYRFRVPVEAKSSDVIINEILFDPKPGQLEYIELYNRSNGTIDLKGYRLGVNNPTDTADIITNEYWPLASGEHAIIAKAYMGIDDPGLFHAADKIIFMPEMPFLPNSGGTLYLFDQHAQVMDKVVYSPVYHHKLLVETKGVSLERNHPENSGMYKNDWHSASSDADYMTPARENSQYIAEENGYQVSVYPKTITPNSDGIDDQLVIAYSMDKGGYIAQVYVYNMSGRRCYTLADGFLLGTKESMIYTGTYEDGSNLPTGMYILLFKACHADGESYIEKRSFVIARED